MVLPGCGKSNSSSSGSAGQTTQITSPKGTVSGTVEDNNGNPIAGASVYVAGQTPVTTNAGGQFSVGVTVTGATAGNGATATTSGTTPNQALTIQIVPPAGYLGASITVTPAAQLTSSDNGSTATGETNPQEVFIDGFSASAGVVMIPATTTTVRGQILNSDTGNAVPTGTTVDLDFIAPQFDQTQHPGIAYSYASGGLLSATTDVNGNFSITNVPDDSCIRMDAPGFTLSNASTPQPACTATTVTDPNGILFATIVESAHSVVFSRIAAIPAVTGDTVPPYVTSVSGVINEAVTPGLLDSATTNTIVVSFSKPVTYTPTAVFQPIVIVGNPPTQTAATITSATLSGQALTIVLSKALPTGALVEVDLPVEAFADSAGNLLTAGSPNATGAPLVTTLSTACPHPILPPETVTCGGVPTAVDYDNLVALAGTGTVDQLTLMTTSTVTTTSPAPTIAQVTTQASKDLTDPGYLTTASLIDTTDSTVAYKTFNSANAAVTSTTGSYDVQFNSQLGNTLVPLVTPSSDAATYLSALATIINGPTKFVYTNIARVTVTIPVGATDVVLSDQVAGVAKDVLFFPINTGQGLPASEAPLGPVGMTGQYEYVFTPPLGVTLPYSFDVDVEGDGNTGVYFPVGSAQGVVLPGDTIVAQTRSSIATLGGSASLVLKDFVPPTTTVQILAKEIAAGAGASTGTGGGVIASTGANTGITILPISPQSGDVVYNGSTLLSADTFADDTLNVALGDTGSGITTAKALTYTNTTSTVPCAVPVTTPPTVPNILGNCVLADATSTAAYLTGEAVKVPLGIDIDEELALTGTTAPTYTGTNATLTNFVAGLNQVNVKGTPTLKANLVGFTASNLVALQADGRAKAVIGLTGAIQDLATTPNVATAADNANVQLRDVFPPLVTRGFYDGVNLVIDFDEPITLTGAITFTDGNLGTCAGQSISLNPTGLAATVPPITLVTGPNGANTEVVIPVQNVYAQTAPFNIGDCLGGTTTSPFKAGYAETAYTAANLGTATALAAAQIVAKPTHGGIDYSTVPDTANDSDIGLNMSTKGANTWANWGSDNLGLNNAQFLVANILGPFALADAVNPNIPQCSGLVAGATSFSCTIVLTQPLLIAAETGVTMDVTGAALPVPNTQGNLTQTQINTFLCGDGVTPGTGKFALVVPQMAGNPFLRARCSSAILENSAGVQVFNNTGTQIILSWSGLTTTGSAALPNLIGEEPVAGDVVELAVPGAAFQNDSTSVFVNGLPFTMSPDLESAYTLPASASLTLGMTPASNGIIANTDNQATPVPAFELIGFVVP